jgi:hypothetical protein
MFYVRIHKLDKATALGPNWPALKPFADVLYIRVRFHLRVYRVPKLDEKQKREKWCPKIVKTDPNWPKSARKCKKVPQKIRSFKPTVEIEPANSTRLTRCPTAIYTNLLLTDPSNRIPPIQFSRPAQFTARNRIAARHCTQLAFNFLVFDVMLQVGSPPAAEGRSPPPVRCSESQKAVTFAPSLQIEP